MNTISLQENTTHNYLFQEYLKSNSHLSYLSWLEDKLMKAQMNNFMYSNFI
jgi:hypothetical protein